MSFVPSIVSQLSKLKELSLPEKITKSDTKSAVEIWEDLNYRSAPVRLSFTEGHSKRCALLRDEDEGSTDSEDTEEESSDDEVEDSIDDEESDEEEDETSEDDA